MQPLQLRLPLPLELVGAAAQLSTMYGLEEVLKHDDGPWLIQN